MKPLAERFRGDQSGLIECLHKIQAKSRFRLVAQEQVGSAAVERVINALCIREHKGSQRRCTMLTDDALSSAWKYARPLYDSWGTVQCCTIHPISTEQC